MGVNFSITGQLVDLAHDRVFPARITIHNGIVSGILPLDAQESPSPEQPLPFLLPGFVDAHVHVESSMLPPTEFARMAVVHGTIGSVSDPHEIANVLGREGVLYMVENAALSPFKYCFGAPSCVPATGFERAGATLDAAAVAELLERPDIGYLAEVMNFPGVLAADPDLLAKIAASKALGKPVDGHAPGLRGRDAARYAAAGIETDHECVTLDEALDKVACGMQILIREGSAVKNFDALWPLLLSHPERVMFCSDDKHPNDLVHGHINQLVARAVANGAPLFDVLRAACVNPVQHYRLPIGLMRIGDPADFIAVEDLVAFNVRQTWIGGREVARDGRSLLERVPTATPNKFAARPISADQLRVRAAGAELRAIVVHDGQLVTSSAWVPTPLSGEWAVASPGDDLLKLVVYNRYQEAAPAVAFVKGFGLNGGALASTVAHDSHNIIAVGADDAALAAAINALVPGGGGVSLADAAGNTDVLPLPIAGLMSDKDGWLVAEAYETLDAAAKALGSALKAPYMSLSFMALLVIPSLKLSDLGLFDGETFAFCDLFR